MSVAKAGQGEDYPEKTVRHVSRERYRAPIPRPVCICLVFQNKAEA
jgi:hypothetical protein